MNVLDRLVGYAILAVLAAAALCWFVRFLWRVGVASRTTEGPDDV